jgi:hypothetical protein
MNDYPRAVITEIPTPWLSEAQRSLADLGLRPDRLVPSLEGGVTLGFTARDRYAEIELRDDGEVIATCAGGNPGTLRVWPVSDLQNALRTIRTFLGT